MRFTTRQLVTVAVFGTLWGIVEITLGSLLKIINAPMSGMILGVTGLTIALMGRGFVPQRGSTLLTGAIAMLLKLFSLGNIIIGPMIGILAEALLAEIVLSLVKQPPRRMAFLAAGSAGVLWVVIQPFVTGPLLFGRSLLVVWLDLVDRIARLFGFSIQAVGVLIALYAVLHIAAGSLAGWLAWVLGHRIQGRTGRATQ